MLSLLTRDPSSLGIDARDKLIGRGLREQHSLACIGINTNLLLLHLVLSFLLPGFWLTLFPKLPSTRCRRLFVWLKTSCVLEESTLQLKRLLTTFISMPKPSLFFLHILRDLFYIFFPLFILFLCPGGSSNDLKQSSISVDSIEVSVVSLQRNGFLKDVFNMRMHF